MNNLLPKKEELLPINGERNTFNDTPFQIEWELLDFKNKLQIVNDLVRQTMMYSDYPNPLNDKETLIGDSYTACNVSIEYLNYLGVGSNYRVVLALGKPYEKDNASSIHCILLIDDDRGKTYQFDATPLVGYKYGKVDTIDKKFYQEYVLVTKELKELFELLRKYSYLLSSKKFDNKDIDTLLNLINYAKKYDALKGIIDKVNSQLFINNIGDRIILNTDPINKEKLFKLLKVWYEELRTLIKEERDLARQLELTQLLESTRSSREPCLIFEGTKYPMSRLTPRFYYDNGLNVVMIKPSAYIFGWEDDVKGRFIEEGFEPIGGYDPGFYEKTGYGIEKMKLFHSHGYKYIREMQGPSEMFLIRRPAEEIGIIKKDLRTELKEEALRKNEVIWFDGKPICWNPMCLNFAHTSDNPSEASMNYSVGHPEYQVMTRFMYPNLVLERKKYNGRI